MPALAAARGNGERGCRERLGCYWKDPLVSCRVRGCRESSEQRQLRPWDQLRSGDVCPGQVLRSELAELRRKALGFVTHGSDVQILHRSRLGPAIGSASPARLACLPSTSGTRFLLGKRRSTSKEHQTSLPASRSEALCWERAASSALWGEAGGPLPGNAVTRGCAETPGSCGRSICSSVFLLHRKPPQKSGANRGRSLRARGHRLPPSPGAPCPVLPGCCSMSFQKHLSTSTACLCFPRIFQRSCLHGEWSTSR